jgi:tetratricopeptide (TPR) repeat protein
MEKVPSSHAPLSFKNAYMLEKEGALTEAVRMYNQLLKKAPSDLEILSRLIILSRKLKNYTKEITYINKAIKIHELKYSSLKSKDAKVISLSRKLNVSLGHSSKLGKNLLVIPEVEKLKKRKDLVLKRMKAIGKSAKTKR